MFVVVEPVQLAACAGPAVAASHPAAATAVIRSLRIPPFSVSEWISAIKRH
jgi:hypothetical protein